MTEPPPMTDTAKKRLAVLEKLKSVDDATKQEREAQLSLRRKLTKAREERAPGDDVEQAMFADVVEGDFTPRVDDVAAPPYPAAAAETTAERPATPAAARAPAGRGWLAGSTTETLDALARDVEASGEEVAWAAGGPWDPLTPAAVSRVAKADAAQLAAAKNAAAAKAAKARDLDRLEAYDAIFDRGRAGEWASRGGVLELAARDAADDVADEAAREALYQVAGDRRAASSSSSPTRSSAATTTMMILTRSSPQNGSSPRATRAGQECHLGNSRPRSTRI
ncbi:hypothetical protein JL721_6346 [Aureococcus anophagefferens]|nr:hypothetical protein JL721_6346 [Aureococcus anophagefferens]